VRWHSDDFPGWVEVSILDAHGQDHRIIEKVPVIALLDITPESSFPIEFWIEAETRSADGGAMVVLLPDGMETTEGKRSLLVVPTVVDQARYRHDRDRLGQAVHDLHPGPPRPDAGPVSSASGLATASLTTGLDRSSPLW
jgi:hypothetical protein